MVVPVDGDIDVPEAVTELDVAEGGTVESGTLDIPSVAVTPTDVTTSLVAGAVLSMDPLSVSTGAMTSLRC